MTTPSPPSWFCTSGHNLHFGASPQRFTSRTRPRATRHQRRGGRCARRAKPATKSRPEKLTTPHPARGGAAGGGAAGGGAAVANSHHYFPTTQFCMTKLTQAFSRVSWLSVCAVVPVDCVRTWRVTLDQIPNRTTKRGSRRPRRNPHRSAGSSQGAPRISRRLILVR